MVAFSRGWLERVDVAAIVFAIVASVGCCAAPGYEGDGKVMGRGFFHSFELDLGAIDISKQAEYRFRMKGLPASELLVGFQTAERPTDGIVRLSLVNGRGQAVVIQRAALGEWVSTTAQGRPTAEYFLYRRGESRDEPAGPGTIKVVRVGVLADGGWGTYFHPHRGEEYRLEVRVERPSLVNLPLHAVVTCLVGSL